MFDFSSFFDVAEDLVKKDDEARIRSGISRYYYSGFGSVRKYLIEVMNETEFRKGFKIHKRIIDRLIFSQDNTEVSIGEKLSDLKELRNDADYDWNLDLNHFEEHLDDVRKKSLEVIEQVDALKKSPPYNL